MAILTAIITHLDAPRVEAQLGYLGALAPQSRFVVCHGGRREDFDELVRDGVDALFVEDSSLRGANRDQSYTGLLRALWEQRAEGDTGAELVYLIEYDHLILSPDFEASLAGVMERSSAGLLGKYASVRNDTNWPHFTRYRHDGELTEFFNRISKRDDPGTRFGCLGTGMLFRRDALEALSALEDVPSAYLELMVPTLVYHLGFEVVDFDLYGDLYAAVRWRPEYGAEDAIAEKAAGRAFVHPFKELEALNRIRETPVPVAHP